MNDELNDVMDRRLRDAHQRVQFRPEWAERVLREITNEVTREKNAVRTGTSWQWVAALAAGIVLTLLGSKWLVSLNSGRSDDSSQLAKFSPPNPPEKLRVEPPVVELRDAVLDSPKVEEVRIAESVTAGSGYLAARLSDESEFEIYVVLPTMDIASR